MIMIDLSHNPCMHLMQEDRVVTQGCVAQADTISPPEEVAGISRNSGLIRNQCSEPYMQGVRS